MIVELGTGYFCEKDLPSAVELIDRKTHLVNKSIESVENVSLLPFSPMTETSRIGLTMIFFYKTDCRAKA